MKITLGCSGGNCITLTTRANDEHIYIGTTNNADTVAVTREEWDDFRLAIYSGKLDTINLFDVE